MTPKILIANRGEIALRVLRACRQKGLATVIVHSTADSQSLAVRLADQSVCIGPPSSTLSYLNVPSILAAAEITGATHIHPGYGFLSEQEHFADAVEQAGLCFIGPQAKHLALMGHKSTARSYVETLGIPCVPGTPPIEIGSCLDSLPDLADKIGFPVLVKAAGGGGGRGMRVVYEKPELLSQIKITQHEAIKAFGDGTVYLEKYLEHPRHIEVQVLGDGEGNAIHIGMRECSMQRRYQKVIEEAQPLALPEEISRQMLQDSVALCQSLKYRGLGTLEFLYQDLRYYFIEMNTRVQVEHPVSEMISSIDLIDAQLDIALGNKRCFDQNKVLFQGHSIECRINAEDPVSYEPCAGTISWLHVPGGPGVRFDSFIYQGCDVSPFYDSLVAKIIVHAPTRLQAIRKMRQALAECAIEGIKTNLPLHRKIFEEKDFIQGIYDTTYLKNHSFF